MPDEMLPEILATIPHQIGEDIDEALVLCLIHEQKMFGNLVYSIPEGGMSMLHLLDILRTLTDVTFEAFLVVAYSNQDSHCEDHPPMYHAATILGRMIAALGSIPVGGALVTKDYWVDYSDNEFTHRDLTDIKQSVTALTLAVEGIHSHRTHHVDIPKPAGADVTSKVEIEAFSAVIPKMKEYSDITGSEHTVFARALWAKCMARDFGPTRPEAVRLIGYFQSIGIRDRLVVDVVDPDIEDEATFTMVLTGQHHVHINKARHERALSLLTNLLQYAEGKHRANILWSLASLEWFGGDSFHAREYLEAVPTKFRTKGRDWDALYNTIAHGHVAESAKLPRQTDED